MKYFKYLLAYVLGFVTYQVIIFLFLGGIEVNTEDNKSLSTSSFSGPYVDQELNEVCQYMKENGCMCQPSIKTNLRCEDTLTGFIQEQYSKDPRKYAQ